LVIETSVYVNISVYVYLCVQARRLISESVVLVMKKNITLWTYE